MPREPASAAEFVAALSAIKIPGGRQLDFLQAHYSAPGKAMTAAGLARKVKYKNWRAINLHYGLIARNVGAALRRRNQGLGLILEFGKPQTLTNAQWVLIMRPEFARALKQVGWVRSD